VAAPCLLAQQQQTKHSAHRHHQRAANMSRGAGSPQVSSPGVSSSGAAATASRVPQSGTPTIENPRPTGTLNTLPNQTLTPGATTVPSNAGGIAPASNGASSGDYTPSEGYSAPTTPGGNPSQTEGVPTFSAPAQPANANLPKTVSPPEQSQPAATRTRRSKKASRKTATKPPAQ
jgi:hypothetical protein